MAGPLVPVPSGSGTDRGAVTIEAALGICAIVAVFGMVLLGVATVIDQIRCQDAAVEAARLHSRGDHVRAEQAIREIAPTGAEPITTVHDDRVDVVIVAPMRIVLPGRILRAEATAILEPGVVR